MEGLTGKDLLKEAAELKPAYAEAEKRTALKYGSIVAVALCLVMTILELVVKKRWNFGMATILFVFAGVADFYEGKKSSKRGMFIKGIVELVLALFFAFLFVGLLFI